MYAALTCDRPYRSRLTPFEALKTISKESELGKLNPKLVRSFINLISSNQFTI